MSIILNAQNISYYYDKQCVLQNLSFTVNKGDFIIITGPNGGGKSTLAKLINNQIQPTSGKIIVHGKIGYAPQKLYPPISLPIKVIDFLNINNKSNPFYQEIYDAFEIDKFASCQLSELSGGQLQKVNICTSIRKNYDLILLDEPDQNLDFESQKVLYKLITPIAKHHTCMIISHDVHSVYTMPNAMVFCINKILHCQGISEFVHSQHCASGH